MPAQDLLNATSKLGYGSFPVDVDGYFFPQSPLQIFMEGKQAHVPLLVGWNSAEMTYQMLLRGKAPTVENYEAAVKQMYGDQAAEALKVYSATNDDDVIPVATALASDLFIAYSTWKWSDAASKTGGKPVFRYFFARPRPQMRPEMGNATGRTRRRCD